MTELRSVDPRTLNPNPDNPRRTPAAKAMDDQLLASITAIGIIQPPVVREVDGTLVIKAGARRVAAAIRAKMDTIDVLVRDTEDTSIPMESLSENLVRAAMNNVDIWRAIESLEQKGWNEQAIADALALPLRTVKRLKLLARLHPPMLDVMAKGSMPSEDHLRTIAAASLEEQAQVWKKYKPKKGEELHWYDLSRALSKRRIAFSSAKFGEDLATAYGVVWTEDLFAPAGEDGRYTTNVEGFFGAQQEWLANSLPEKGTLLTQNGYGQPELPKKAERVYGKPGKGDILGHYLDPHSGEVKTVAYRMPVAKKAAKAGTEEAAHLPEAPAPKARPDVTGRGNAMIGDLRTDALQRALAENAATDQTLIALLVMALAGRNVSVQGPNPTGAFDRQALGGVITEGGVITSDDALIRKTAREMLVSVLSCRDNMSNSGIVARIAGEAIGATAYLPNMATEEFLSCLSRQALERSAATEGVRVEVRVKDTRARMVERFKDQTWHFAGGLFALSADEAGAIATTEGDEDTSVEPADLNSEAGDENGLEDNGNQSGDEPVENNEDLYVGPVPMPLIHTSPGLAIAAE
jgi:ParB family chromosome partitioning protein